MPSTPPDKSPPPVSAAWGSFERSLAAVLAKLKKGQYLILSVKHSLRFVQFAGQGPQGIRAETTSNSYLPKTESLDKKQIQAMKKVGWLAPTSSPESSTPEQQPDGSPNFYRQFAHPIQAGEIARLTVATLADILRVPHPGFLDYEAFDDDGSLEFAELGLKPREPADAPDEMETIRRNLLSTLKEITSLADLEYDEDGDVAIRVGSAMVFARANDARLSVLFYSPILSEISLTEGLLNRLNDINANLTLARFVYRNDCVYGLVNVPATPYVNQHVKLAFAELCAVADGMDELLQIEFGGSTAFEENVFSSRKH